MDHSGDDGDEIVVNRAHPLQDLTRPRERDTQRYRYRYAEQLLPDPPAQGAQLLDVGGGQGEFTELARGHGYVTTLVDGNPYNVEAEQQRGHDARRVDLTRGLPGIEGDIFDGAACLDVIEHIVPAELLLQEMNRVLKPGAFLLLSTPNFSFVRDRVNYLKGMPPRGEGYHFRFFTQSGLIAMCKTAGFEVVERRSAASPIGVRTLVRLVTAGRKRLPPVFVAPPLLESMLARTLIWRLRKN